MNLYEKYVLPKITHLACASGPAMKQRAKIVPHVTGNVLEIGVGSGLNFKFYDPSKVNHLFGLDPSAEMMALAQKQADQVAFSIDLLEAPAEGIPLEDGAVDAVLITYTMCTIPDVPVALSEMRRVLKPGGKLFFCEHGIAPDKSVRRWQRLLNPVWKKLGGGCNLNRNIPKLIEEGGFDISQLETMYIPGFKPACFNFWGMAAPR